MRIDLRVLSAEVLPSRWLKSRTYAKELAWVAFGSALTLVGGVVMLKYLTTVLAPAQYGELNLVLTAIILPGWILFAPLSQGAVRWYAQEKEAGRDARLVTVSLAGYGLSGLAALAVAALASELGLREALGVPLSSWWLAYLLLVLDNLLNLALGFAGAARHRSKVAIVGTVSVWLRLLLVVVSSLAIGTSPALVVAAYALATAILVVPSWAPLAKGARWGAFTAEDWKLLRRMCAYGIPFGLWSCFAWAQQYIDRYAVDAWLGRNATGVYVGALQVASLPFTIMGAVMSQFLTPIVYEKAGPGTDYARVRHAAMIVVRASILFSAAGSLVVLAYFLEGGRIVSIFATSAYQIPNLSLTVLAAGALAGAVAQQLTIVLLTRHRSDLLLAGRVAVSVVSVPVIWMLTAEFGLRGAVLGYAANGLLFLIAVLFLALHVLRAR